MSNTDFLGLLAIDQRLLPVNVQKFNIVLKLFLLKYPQNYFKPKTLVKPLCLASYLPAKYFYKRTNFPVANIQFPPLEMLNFDFSKHGDL